MLPHWHRVVQPLLTAIDAGPILEIGAFSGETTELLAPFVAERGVVLHVIDPDPRFDVAKFERRFGENFRLHKARSHDVLEQIEPAAAVLIDGDHNWYTVHGELERLERVAAASNRPFPLVMFHDVEWPYARRDMYWDPETIPEEWLQPWSRDGIRWGQGPLDQDGGISRGNAQAIEEGGPHNGVLTAVEDFVKERHPRFELRIVNGDHGLGLLAPSELLATSEAVRHQWEALRSTEFLAELARQQAGVALMENAALKEAREEIDHLKRELNAARSAES